jgi:hypothetical protein
MSQARVLSCPRSPISALSSAVGPIYWAPGGALVSTWSCTMASATRRGSPSAPSCPEACGAQGMELPQEQTRELVADSTNDPMDQSPLAPAGLEHRVAGGHPRCHVAVGPMRYPIACMP